MQGIGVALAPRIEQLHQVLCDDHDARLTTPRKCRQLTIPRFGEEQRRSCLALVGIPELMM
jgi:hypothetical protein